MNQPEMRFGDLLVSRVLVTGTIGFLLSRLVVATLEQTLLREIEGPMKSRLKINEIVT